MSRRRTNHHSTDRVKAATRRDDVRREPILDIRVVDVFPNSHQLRAFRTLVTSLRVPVAKQYALAKQINVHKDFTKQQVGAPYIKSKVLEWIKQGMPDVVTNDAAGTERYHRNIRHAIETCSVCAKCGVELAADASVWRERLFLGQGQPGRDGVHPGMRFAIAPVCERCRAEFSFGSPRPCESCGRPVHQDREREHTVCCETCARAVRLAVARQRRTETRGTRQCENESCGETFEPTRDDARFCSSRCRQQAYRKRKALTDDDLGTARPDVISRNAKARAP